MLITQEEEEEEEEEEEVTVRPILIAVKPIVESTTGSCAGLPTCTQVAKAGLPVRAC